MAQDKFDSLFEKTAEKMGDKTTIDFKGSDIDQKGAGAKKTVNIPAKSTAKEKTQKKDKRLAVYLTESEYEAFIATFKPLEKVADRIRGLILEDIKKRRNNAKDDNKACLMQDVWVKINESLAKKWAIKITITLTNKEAMAFAEFLKRVHFTDYRNNAKDDNEAYLMQDVWVKINELLAKKWAIKITITLTNKEAMAFAEFLKRVHFINYRNNARNDDEAYLMQSAWIKIKDFFAEKWFDPR